MLMTLFLHVVPCKVLPIQGHAPIPTAYQLLIIKAKKMHYLSTLFWSRPDLANRQSPN